LIKYAKGLPQCPNHGHQETVLTGGPCVVKIVAFPLFEIFDILRQHWGIYSRRQIFAETVAHQEATDDSVVQFRNVAKLP